MSLMKYLRNGWDRVYHDSLQKGDDPRSVLFQKISGTVGGASELLEKSLRFGLFEVMSTLRVTTYHPMGWSWQYFKDQLDLNLATQESGVLNEQLFCPVLLIHGISHNSSAFYTLKNSAQREGFQKFRTLEMLTTLHDISSMGQRLMDECIKAYHEHKQSGGTGKVRIVAHSLGGMIVRGALLDPHLADYVDRVVFLGVPHQGNFFYRFPLLRSIKDLSPRSRLMKKIKETPLPGGIEYWNIRGMLDIVTPSRDTFLPTVPNLSFENVGHAGLLTDPKVIDAVLNILRKAPAL